jgi:hypothetical protein
MHRYSNFTNTPASPPMADPAMAQSKVFQGMLRTVLVAAGCASSCVVQGGEENYQTDTAMIELIRYEAKNQDGVIVGSGCTVKTGDTGERIHFSAAPGDRIELTERTEVILDKRATVDQHGLDDAFWCSQKSQALASFQPIDARCFKTVERSSTVACFLEHDWVGKISHAELIPPEAELKPGKVLGFTLQIDVLAQGKQCAVSQCAGEDTPSGAGVIFVIDKP